MSDSGSEWPAYEQSGRPLDKPAGELTDPALSGQIGVVVVAIRGGDRPGEILVRHRGISETFIAFADEPVDRGVEVRVTTVRGPRQVGVSPVTA